MQLQTLKVSECYESETNPRGAKFEGAQFDELVASVREKGVLVPVLARPRPKAGKKFEVVAGSRRLRAATKAGLKEIPAQVEEMADDAAREAQIVENLQRADVHPLEEGEAYRQLIEDGGRTVADVAVKVGKPQDYVRQRLFLTNLVPTLRDAYRKAQIGDAAAYLIAKLGHNDQAVTLKELKNWSGGLSRISTQSLKEWIEKKFYHPLAFQPWLADKDVAAAVGACKECPPVREALFGTIKAGQCTDLKCWRRKMDVYIAHRRKENSELLMVSKEYGDAGKGVLSRSQYEGLPSNAKKHCDYAQQAIVAEGPDTGSVMWVCADKECPKHHYQHSEYVPSEKEKAQRKKEREKEAAKHEKFDAAVTKALEKLRWPLSQKHLDALFDMTLQRSGTSFQMPIVKRHGLAAEKRKTSYGVKRDYEAPLRKFAEEGGNDAKLRMIFELLLPTYNRYGDSGELNKRIAKL